MLKNQKGLSLLEMVVAGGMLAGISMVGVKVIDNQAKFQKQVEGRSELMSIKSHIDMILLNGNACVNTLGGAGAPIADGMAVAAIRDRNNSITFEKDQTYSNNTVGVKDILLTDLTLSTLPDGTKYGTAAIAIDFYLSNKSVASKMTLRKKFFISIGLDSLNNLVKCYSSTENAVNQAKQEVCDMFGGVWNAPMDRCDLKSYVDNTNPFPENFDAASTKYVIDAIGAIPSNPTITISPSACPTGQFVRSMSYNSSTGRISYTCSAPPAGSTFSTSGGVSCGTNQAVKRVSISSSGVLSGTCGSTQYTTGY